MLKDVYSGTLIKPGDDIGNKFKEILNTLVNENPYANIPQKIIVEPNSSLDYSENGYKENGRYFPASNIMEISWNLLHETLVARSKPIIELFSTLGHETEHASQELLYKHLRNLKNTNSLSDKDKLKYQLLMDDYGAKKLDKNSVAILIELIEGGLGKKINGISDQNKEQRKQIYEELAYNLYFRNEHERDARQKGYDYANYMIDSLCSNPNLDKSIKVDLMRQKMHLKIEKDKDGEENKQFETLRKVIDDALEDMDIVDFAKFVKETKDAISEIEPYREDEGKYDKKGYVQSKLNDAMDFLVSEICRGKSADQVMDYVLKTCSAGYKEIIPEMLKLLNGKIDFLEEKQKELKSKIVDILMQNDVVPDVYGADYSALYDLEEKKIIFLQLLSQNQEVKAFEFYGRNFVVENTHSKTSVILENEIIESLKKYLEETKSTGKISPYEHKVIFSQSVLRMSKDEADKPVIVQLDEEMAQLIKDKKVKYMTMREEYDYMKEKYGEVFAKFAKEDLIKGSKRFEFVMEIYKQEEARKQQKKAEEQQKKAEEMFASGRILTDGVEPTQE